MDKKRYIFISYSSKDIFFVNQITDMMKRNNITYWKAPEMIPAGSNYAKEIPKAISECEVFLLVLSANSQESIWVEKELDSAICCRRKIIPLRIDKTDMNDLYRFYLNNVQMVQADVINGEITNLDEIIKVINLNLGENEQASVETKSYDSNIEEQDEVKPQKNYRIFEEETNKRVRKPDKRSNAFRVNRIPVECEYCGGEVVLSSLGVYTCIECEKENYDDFKKVRNYLEEVGTAPAVVISRNTGVPIKTVEHLWKSDVIEESWKPSNGVTCKSCGMAISNGSLCDSCKSKLSDMNSKDSKGAWHSTRWKK